MRYWAFWALLWSCATPAILVNQPGETGCFPIETPCVDSAVKWTGYCCPGGYACSGPPPNVGCGTQIGDKCCPTQGGLSEYQMPVRQRAAR